MPNQKIFDHRSAKPALSRVRLQKAAGRVLLLLDGEATSRDVVDWAYCRKVLRGERIEKRTIGLYAERSHELPARSSLGNEYVDARSFPRWPMRSGMEAPL